MQKKCEICLGNSEAIEVIYPFDSRSENNHALLVGISGCGKSTQLEKMESDAVKNGKKIIELDFSDSSCAKRSLAEQVHIINIRENSDLSPLCKRADAYGKLEEPVDFSKRVTDVLTGTLNFKPRQQAVLYGTIKEVAEQSDQLSFKAILAWLALNNDSSAESICTKLQYLADTNVFGNYKTGGWRELFQHQKPIQILSLSGFPPMERKIIAELLLEDLHNYLVECGPGQNDFVLILDECQNLRLTSNMPTAFFLSQGRKYGCGVWLATQSPDYFKRDELVQLYQPALVLNFQPNADERSKICRKLAKTEKERLKLLSMFEQLERGQFVASGRFLTTRGNLSKYTHLLISNVL